FPELHRTLKRYRCVAAWKYATSYTYIMQPPDWQLQRASPKRKRHGGNVKQTLFFSDHSPWADVLFSSRPPRGHTHTTLGLVIIFVVGIVNKPVLKPFPLVIRRQQLQEFTSIKILSEIKMVDLFKYHFSNERFKS
ncbi:hypothetical protein, partial [Enterobacter cloacae complex sp. 2DZ2F20B]|uniref:hypothetical protein n=1 Tax=Enterobacter cloacae complex sp. 2DZ2F20B TaxID=2511993 RepID=UPI001CA51B4D